MTYDGENRLDDLERRMEADRRRLADRMTQLMSIVGEMHRHTPHPYGGPFSWEERLLVLEKKAEHHKRKLADLEEEMALLKLS